MAAGGARAAADVAGDRLPQRHIARGIWAFLLAFRQGLSETDYVEGRNVLFEYRWAEGHYDRLPALVADLISSRVTVIAATTTPANFIAKTATTTIPIVFTTSSDPVDLGLVASLSRPGGNVTGVVTLNVELASKRLEQLHELVPSTSVIALLINPTNPNVKNELNDLQGSAHTIGHQLLVLEARTEDEIDMAFASFVQRRPGRFLSTWMLFSSASAINSSLWQNAMQFLRSSIGGSSPSLVV